MEGQIKRYKNFMSGFKTYFARLYPEEAKLLLSPNLIKTSSPNFVMRSDVETIFLKGAKVAEKDIFKNNENESEPACTEFFILHFVN